MSGMQAIRRFFGSDTVLRRFALGSLIANIGLVVTGGAVRLTGSGLGCPTWPTCNGVDYIQVAAVSYHKRIEETNRTLTGVLIVFAVLTVLAAFAQAKQPGREGLRRSQIWWSIAVLAGIPAQAVLGGISVLTELNPWVVACHFLLSSVIIALAYQMWMLARPPLPSDRAAAPLRALVWAIVAMTAAVLIAGTVTTGSGPHAGDEHAKRTGLNPESIAQLHTDLVMLLIGLSVAAWFAFRVTGASAAARTAAILVAVECSQAVIGFVQYFTHLPITLVDLHMLGACLVWIAALRLLSATRPLTATVDEVKSAPAARTPAEITP